MPPSISTVVIAQVTARAGLAACLESVASLSDQLFLFDQTGEFGKEAKDAGADYLRCPYGTAEISSEKDALPVCTNDLILYMLGCDLLPPAGIKFVENVRDGLLFPGCNVFYAPAQDTSSHVNHDYEFVRRYARPFLFRRGFVSPVMPPHFVRDPMPGSCYVLPSTESILGWQLEDRTNDRDLLEHYRKIRGQLSVMRLDLQPNIDAIEGSLGE